MWYFKKKVSEKEKSEDKDIKKECKRSLDSDEKIINHTDHIIIIRSVSYDDSVLIFCVACERLIAKIFIPEDKYLKRLTIYSEDNYFAELGDKK